MRKSHIETRHRTLLGRAQLATALALSGVLFAALGALALAKPTGRILPSGTEYSQAGELSYGGLATGTAVYANGAVTTGQPVYATQVPALSIGFRYHVSGRSVMAAGTAEIFGVVDLGQGLTRQFTLASPTSFSGASAVTSGTFRPQSVVSEVARAQAVIGDAASGAQLRIEPVVSVHGTSSGHRFSAGFAPVYSFSVVDGELVLDNPLGVPGSQPVFTSALVATEKGPVDHLSPVAQTLSLLGSHLRVSTARLVGLIGTLLLLGTAAFVARPLLSKRRDRAEPLKTRPVYVSLLDPISGRHFSLASESPQNARSAS